MSNLMFSKDQLDLLSAVGEAGGNDEGNYTTAHPPPYNDNNQPSGRSLPSGPSATPQTVMSTSQTPGQQLEGAGQHYPASDSSATVRPDEVASVTQALQDSLPQHGFLYELVPRMHILFHLDRDYNGGAQPLTERAIAALNYDFAHGSSNSNVEQWIHGRSQFSSDPAGINMSILRSPRTETESRTGSKSSFSMVSSSTVQPSQMEHVNFTVCAAGLQFADVSAPAARQLLDEDCV
ncbi:hypothetical protein F5Y03DRAFT_114904 [Xylaria venustula]|nr:hypothetical protein F5Y03DRAFT_114904 [Xylaria venustula]